MNDIDILEYKKGEEQYWNNCEIASKHVAKDDENEIEDLNDWILYSKRRRKKMCRRDE